MLLTLYKIGGVHFRLFGANGFHVKANNERFTAASSRCGQNLKYENFTSSFGRLCQKTVPQSVLHVKHNYFSSFNQSNHWFVVTLPSSNLRLPIDLFSLYILFSHFRPRDATRGNSFFQMSSHARANLRITNEKTKGKFPWGHHVFWNGKTKCTRSIRQARRKRKPHKFAYLTSEWKKHFCTLCTCIFHFPFAFCGCSCLFDDVKWPVLGSLGPVHTYPDIFESATFSFRIRLSSTRIRRIRKRIRTFLNPHSRVEIF